MGGVTGTDVCTIFKTGRTGYIRGIANHQCTNIDIGTVGGVNAKSINVSGGLRLI
jgi:hypothetical protein